MDTAAGEVSIRTSECSPVDEMNSDVRTTKSGRKRR